MLFATHAICNNTICTCRICKNTICTCIICNMCNLKHVQFETCAICNMCNLQHMQFAARAICNTSNLKNISISTIEVRRALPCELGCPSPEGWEGVSILSFLRFIGMGLPFLGRGHWGHWRPYPIARAFIMCFLQLRDFCIWEISLIILIIFLIYDWDIS